MMPDNKGIETVNRHAKKQMALWRIINMRKARSEATLACFSKYPQDLSSITIRKMDNNWLEIKSGNSHFKLVGLPVEEYPSLPQLDNQKKMTLPAAILKESIRRVIFAIAQEDIRYAMNGALFSVEGNR